jgi:RNA-directed DNA polymerase
MKELYDDQRLFDDLCNVGALRQGFKAVKANRGAPGIDGVSVKDFERDLDKELRQLLEELSSWTYRPKPVKRVDIPKPDNKGTRPLGIPTVRDRVVQATIKLLIEPVFEPTFSPSSYGFRPGRNQRQAVQAACEIINSGKAYVVDIDLSKCFDRISQDRLMARLRQTIGDKRLLRLIGLTLRSGILIDGFVSPSDEGVVQGSPLSPLLSNIVLDEWDKELERRGLSFCRFADDCNIFVGSRKAADRVMNSISNFIERRLKLKVNRDKSQVAHSSEVKFLGMTIINGTIAIAWLSMNRAMQMVKELTPRGTHLNLEQTIARINRWYRGWANYFAMTQYPAQLKRIEAHIRRRLRSRLVDQQKSRRNLCRKLIKRGISRPVAKMTAYSHRKRWALSGTMTLARAYPVDYFIHTLGQYIHSNRRHAHWFAVNRWIKLA